MNKFNLDRFNLEDKEQVFKLHKKVISTKKNYEKLWGMWYYETEEEAKEVYEELRKIVGNRCL